MLESLKNQIDSKANFLGRMSSALQNKISTLAKYSAIGIDMGNDIIKLVQLGNIHEDPKNLSLVTAGFENRPADIIPGTGNWQRWAIEAIKKITSDGNFHGRDVIAAIPATEVFIDHVKMPTSQSDNWTEIVSSKIKPKLPFDSDNAMIKFIPTEDKNVMVIATEREKINRYLAIYERANLKIKSITIWPSALANTYVRFFGRRKADEQAVVMLIDVEANATNVVVTRSKNILFARSIPSTGAKQLATDEEAAAKLTSELVACKRGFESLYRKAHIERLIFISGQTTERETCGTIAKSLAMPAQMGDCLAAIKIANPYDIGIERRGCKFSWATSFGLGLS